MKTAKLMIKLALVIAVAAFCSGYFGKTYQQNTVEYVVKEGDTLWYVAGQYFSKEQKENNFGEFQWRIREDNAELFADGRQLQPGDVITVRYYTVTTKQ